MALRRAIVEQALEPGMKLPEDAIGEQFGVSRTIVRRALEQLAADELIEILPHRGASVVRPTLEQAHDLFQIRIDLEDIVVRRLCGSLTAAQAERLRAAVAEEEQAHGAGLPDYIRLSAEFHLVLAEMTASPTLERYLRHLIWRSALVLRLYGRPKWDPCNVEEHKTLIDSLSNGDVERCRQVMRLHLESVLTRALDGAKASQDPGLRDILSRYADETAEG